MKHALVITMFLIVLTSKYSYASTPCNGESGKPHSNGGGFVADTASVSESVYVSKDSQICGNIEIFQSGPISSSHITGVGLIINDGPISHSKLSGHFHIIGNEEKYVTLTNAIISGPTTVLDDEETIEFIRLSMDVTINNAEVRGKNIGIHNGATLHPGARVIGENIDISGVDVHSSVSSCTELTSKKKGRHDLCESVDDSNDTSKPSKSAQ